MVLLLRKKAGLELDLAGLACCLNCFVIYSCLRFLHKGYECFLYNF